MLLVFFSNVKLYHNVVVSQSEQDGRKKVTQNQMW